MEATVDQEFTKQVSKPEKPKPRILNAFRGITSALRHPLSNNKNNPQEINSPEKSKEIDVSDNRSLLERIDISESKNNFTEAIKMVLELDVMSNGTFVTRIPSRTGEDAIFFRKATPEYDQYSGEINGLKYYGFHSDGRPIYLSGGLSDRISEKLGVRFRNLPNNRVHGETLEDQDEFSSQHKLGEAQIVSHQGSFGLWVENMRYSLLSSSLDKRYRSDHIKIARQIEEHVLEGVNQRYPEVQLQPVPRSQFPAFNNI